MPALSPLTEISKDPSIQPEDRAAGRGAGQSHVWKAFKREWQRVYQEELPRARERGLSANMADYVAQQIATQRAEELLAEREQQPTGHATTT